MSHVGVISPNAPGHLNPMTALANALRHGGVAATFFLGDPPAAVESAGFEVVLLGGSLFPTDEYRAGFERLGTLEGRAALEQTIALGVRGRGHRGDRPPGRRRPRRLGAPVRPGGRC